MSGDLFRGDVTPVPKAAQLERPAGVSQVDAAEAATAQDVDGDAHLAPPRRAGVVAGPVGASAVQPVGGEAVDAERPAVGGRATEHDPAQRLTEALQREATAVRGCQLLTDRAVAAEARAVQAELERDELDARLRRALSTLRAISSLGGDVIAEKDIAATFAEARSLAYVWCEIETRDEAVARFAAARFAARRADVVGAEEGSGSVSGFGERQ